MEQHFFARQIPRDWPVPACSVSELPRPSGRVELALRGALLLGGASCLTFFLMGCVFLFTLFESGVGAIA